MRTVNVKLRKGWRLMMDNEICDWAAPIGALVWGAQPEKSSAQSFVVYVYRPLNGGAEEERTACPCRGNVNQYTYGGYNCYGLFTSYHSGDFVIHRHFLQVEDYVVCVVTTGTASQAQSISEWVDKHMALGEEIPDNNGSPLQGGMPLVPPAMLPQMVDFTAEDYAATASACPIGVSYFDFIVRASLVPAVSVDELITRVNLCYSQHQGYREIDYSQLTPSAQAKLQEMDDSYIGLAHEFTNPWGVKVINALVVGSPVQVNANDPYGELSRMIEEESYKIENFD